MATVDSEAATVLKNIPESGTTARQLVVATQFDVMRIEAAVERLLSLGLVQMSGETIAVTPFAQKARSLFDIVWSGRLLKAYGDNIVVKALGMAAPGPPLVGRSPAPAV